MTNKVIIVGAGFQQSVLEENFILPTSKNIISLIAGKENSELHILHYLTKTLNPELLSLDYIWNANHQGKIFQSISSEKITDILRNYDNTSIGNIIKYYSQAIYPHVGVSFYERPKELLFIILGIELKKLVSVAYKYNPELKFKTKLIKQYIRNENISWISMNYDVVLESIFQKFKYSWDYCFSSKITNKNIVKKFIHKVIKPHGSLNVCFHTYREGLNKTEDELYYIDESKPLKTFNFKDFGYTNYTVPFTEKRPWLIGYLMDEFKDEINSSTKSSDIAHDLNKLNLLETRFELNKATDIMIWGYSLSSADLWMQNYLKEIPNKKINFEIASDKDSSKIKNLLIELGYLENNIKIIGDNGKLS